jgi:glutathione S-transferase
MTPYVLRLEHLGLSWFWDDMPEVADWFERVKARANYGAIADHLDPKYLDLFESLPAEAHGRVRQICELA